MAESHEDESSFSLFSFLNLQWCSSTRNPGDAGCDDVQLVQARRSSTHSVLVARRLSDGPKRQIQWVHDGNFGHFANNPRIGPTLHFLWQLHTGSCEWGATACQLSLVKWTIRYAYWPSLSLSNLHVTKHDLPDHHRDHPAFLWCGRSPPSIQGHKLEALSPPWLPL